MVVGASDVGVGEGDEDWAATSEEGDGCDSDVPVNEAEAAAEESLRQWQHTDEETEQGSNQRRRRFWRYAGELTLLGIGRLCRGGGGSCCLLRRVGGWLCGTIVLPGDK